MANQIVMKCKALVFSIISSFSYIFPYPSFAEHIQLPDRLKLAESKLEQIAKENERTAKLYLELFLKCDGKNGNAEFSLDYGNVNEHYINNDGKCVTIYGGGFQ